MSQSGESPEFISNIIESLREKEKHYQAGNHVIKAISDKTMTALVGASGAGKTTIVTEVVRLDPDLKEANTITTRPGREGDPDGFQTGVSYTSFNKNVDKGNFVNFNVIVQNGHGTKAKGFPGQHNIGPIMSRSVPQLLNAGFREINIVYPLVEEEQYYDTLMSERVDFTDFAPRAEEGDESIGFAELNMGADWLHFVENSFEPDGVTKAARTVLNIVHHRTGEFMTYDRAQKLLDGMRNALRRASQERERR